MPNGSTVPELEKAIAQYTQCQDAIAQGFAKAASERNEKKALYGTLLAGLDLLKMDEAMKGRFDYEEDKKYMAAKLKMDGKKFGRIALGAYSGFEYSVSGSMSYPAEAATSLERIAETVDKLARRPQGGRIRRMLARAFK